MCRWIWTALIVLGTGLGGPRLGVAQQPADTTASQDSLMTYDLAEVVVTGSQSSPQSPTTMHRVSLASIAQLDAPTVEEVFDLVPAAFVTTNSRGQTLVYLRNAGERQTALFFNGASLNIPWDQRFDISLVPSSVVGQMTVSKGVPSVLYGTNVVGGAINLTSRTLRNPGRLWEVTARGGSAGYQEGVVTHLGKSGRWDYAVSAGYLSRDGTPLPEDPQLPFSQTARDTDDDVRTNTDRELLNLFGQASYSLSPDSKIGVALLHLGAEKGVAPESHLDPTQDRVRYWRYPEWRTTAFILSGDARLGRGATRLRGAAWVNSFAQQIRQYDSVAYDDLAEVQDDDDLTVGTRLTVYRPVGGGEARVTLNALTSRHGQTNRTPEEGTLPEVDSVPEDVYRQHIFSLGAEYEWQPTAPLTVILGASLDGIATPETGDKPARDPLTDYGVTAAALYDLDSHWSVRAATGRRIRFPTMRELFGEALNRFLVNPDLRPESAWLAEVGLERQGAAFSGELTAFLNRTFDTIDRRNVVVDGDRKRQRINLDGSRVFGVEVAGVAKPVRGLRLDGHLTWMRPRTLNDGDTAFFGERPEWIGTLTTSYRFRHGFSVQGQAVYTGTAYSLAEDNTFVELPTSTVFNMRLGYYFSVARALPEVFVRVDNVADERVLTQLGLPAAGRELIVGLTLSL